MSLGNRISELRNALGVSQVDLAKTLGVSRQAVSKWENDLTSPDTYNLIQLADLLDTDIEYLATGRRTYGRRPPVVLKTVETVEKVVEKPVVVEEVVKQVVEKPIVEYVDKPIIKKITRVKYLRNPVEFSIFGGACFLLGLLIGWMW